MIRAGTRVINILRGSPNELREGRVIGEWDPEITWNFPDGRSERHPPLAVVLYPNGSEDALLPEYLERLSQRVPTLQEEQDSADRWFCFHEQVMAESVHYSGRGTRP